MKKVGFVGWRGMVGSVLMNRMVQEQDFHEIQPVFFSTSAVGQRSPIFSGVAPLNSELWNAYDVAQLAKCDIILTCQGGDYTHAVFDKLREFGWQGHWIDAASTLRMKEDTVLVLDPVNLSIIERQLQQGNRNWIGCNCTVSLMLMAIGGLFQHQMVEWVSSMTYQAVSGGGAERMRDLLNQMGKLYHNVESLLCGTNSSILEIDQQVNATLRQAEFSSKGFNYIPIAGNLIPWIDIPYPNGQSKEEWKGGVECNKILGLPEYGKAGFIPIDGTCVRVGSMRCHALAMTIKLKEPLPLLTIEQMIAESNAWVKVVPNERTITEQQLTPAAISGTLTVAVGRLRKLMMGEQYLGAFAIGDQLLWGAAEPLRRILRIIIH